MPVTDLVEVKATVSVDAYRVISMAVEEGVGWGMMHAYKHTDEPGRDAIRDHIVQDVMNELCEVLSFGDDE